MKVSVIIPTFNEEKVIGECLTSLAEQTDKDIEIIVIDDGSSDKTKEIVQEYPVKLLEQKHQGPAVARNLGAKEAKGEILVFVDADMTFAKDFISKLINPITAGQAIGTFSKEEYVLNKNNIWSKCWNINKGLPMDKMHTKNYPDNQAVFRAILKKEFDKVDGFSAIGYIDDHTLAKKLNTLASNAPGAIFYHRNPESLGEVFKQARWIGKSEYKNRKIKNELLMKLVAIIRYSPPFSLINGLSNSMTYGMWQFLVFKIVYDLAIETSLIGSFFNEQKYK